MSNTKALVMQDRWAHSQTNMTDHMDSCQFICSNNKERTTTTPTTTQKHTYTYVFCSFAILDFNWELTFCAALRLSSFSFSSCASRICSAAFFLCSYSCFCRCSSCHPPSPYGYSHTYDKHGAKVYNGAK